MGKIGELVSAAATTGENEVATSVRWSCRGEQMDEWRERDATFLFIANNNKNK